MSEKAKNPTKKAKRVQSDSDILKVFQTLNILCAVNEPYNRDAQMRNLQRFSLFTDNNQYYASGDTRDR